MWNEAKANSNQMCPVLNWLHLRAETAGHGDDGVLEIVRILEILKLLDILEIMKILRIMETMAILNGDHGDPCHGDPGDPEDAGIPGDPQDHGDPEDPGIITILVLIIQGPDITLPTLNKL